MTMVPVRLLTSVTNNTSATTVTNAFDLMCDDTQLDDVLDEFQASFVPGYMGQFTASHSLKILRIMAAAYDGGTGKWSFLVELAERIVAIAGTRPTPSGDKQPYGLGIYYKTGDSSVGTRSAKLIVKPDIYEGDTVAAGTIWGASGTLGTAIANFLTTMNSSYTTFRLVNLHKGRYVPYTAGVTKVRWINKYRYPRPVLV